MKKKLRKESKLVKELMDPMDIIKQGDARKAEYDRQAADAIKAKQQQIIKSIWIKKITDSGSTSTADLEITYANGEVTSSTFDVTITGDYDTLYKNVERTFRQQIRSKGYGAKLVATIPAKDIQVTYVHIAFNDPRIVWFYGKQKATDNDWEYKNVAREAAKKLDDPSIFDRIKD